MKNHTKSEIKKRWQWGLTLYKVVKTTHWKTPFKFVPKKRKNLGRSRKLVTNQVTEYSVNGSDHKILILVYPLDA